MERQGVIPAWDDPWADPNKEFCRPDHTDTFCTGLVLWCKDVFLCYTGSRGTYYKSRTPYPCGVCVGVTDPSDW
jgi:hypothetical protein